MAEQTHVHEQGRPVAVVTGAGRRLGLFMTQSLLSQGWHVVAVTRSIEPNPTTEGESLTSLDSEHLDIVCCDLLCEQAVEGLGHMLLNRYGGLDFLLHNASIFEKDTAYAACATEQMAFYDDLYRIHMKAPARLNQLLAPALAQSQRPTGNIIHITDIYVNNPNPAFALYCSTKAGAENLMVSFAKLLAPRVRVNAIQPGPVKFLPSHTQAEKKQVLSETLLATEGGFEALEQGIYSILNNEYMTAAVVRVDGGRAVAG
ncbi:SDR family NAD(P)-dependent oxidoreductase [Aliidiomarina taiwanensis]|nr:SDR family NAD(P)-dependent oxidoreductase [Aliidiomarina taiwanensis]